jgi:Cu-Zn family superoxide dismutase
MERKLVGVALGVALAMGAGVGLGQAPGAESSTHRGLPKDVKVKLVGSHGQPAGTVEFKQVKAGVKVTVKLENVPFGEHGVHIHEHAVCDAPDFHAAGGHFNPDGKRHGFQNPEGHHAGDLPGNVSVGEDHRGQASFVLKDLSMDPNLPDSIFANGGTSVVVHEHADDEKTDPSGESGNRIACGVVKE